MKKLLVILFLIPFVSFAQTDARTAIVTKYNNIPVFIMSEPVKEYNVVGAVTIAVNLVFNCLKTN